MTKNDLADALVWVRGGGFQGELREEDSARSRTVRDATALLADYPAQAPRCPEHDLPLELRQGDRGP